MDNWTLFMGVRGFANTGDSLSYRCFSHSRSSFWVAFLFFVCRICIYSRLLRVRGWPQFFFFNYSILYYGKTFFHVVNSRKNFFFFFTFSQELPFDALNGASLVRLVWRKADQLALKVYFNNLFFPLWGRIAFRGKSYRMRNFKNMNKITFNLGYSHWTKIVFSPNLWWFYKRRRQSYFIQCQTIAAFLRFEVELHYLRVMNRYTRRGVRMRKAPLIQRFGKISQYVSLLH